ncbi:MAG TPA: iron uptake system protein EfeO [Povalibacter sp.]|nr:iron uptake system protein EfeO [Povalibacter sp.]
MAPTSSSRTTSGLRWAVLGSAALVIAGVVAFWWAAGVARRAPPKASENAITITIRNNVCEPNEITVPAGRTTFTILNQSQRALEWEILDGVMVVEERENIAPGFSQTMTVKLQPGEFDITCGLLSNPRGRLHVTPSATSDAEAARPSLVAYVGALAEYRVFLALEAGMLEENAQALSDAIRAGDADQARALYVPAHQAYKRIEPMAELFADLDARLNARAEYFEQREADPAFTGFHRIEYGLFGATQSDVKALVPVAEQLLGDIAQLRERLRSLNVPPQRLASASAKLLGRVADNLPAGGEDHYAHAEAANLQGTLDGTRKIAELLSPLLGKAAPELDRTIEQRLDQLSAALDPYRQADGFKLAVLDQAQRQRLVEAVRALAEAFGGVNAALGLE